MEIAQLSCPYSYIQNKTSTTPNNQWNVVKQVICGAMFFIKVLNLRCALIVSFFVTSVRHLIEVTDFFEVSLEF
jgi:hypothetical protein